MKENEIRPKQIFDEYLRLCKEDIVKYFSRCSFEHIDCPACENRGSFKFEKDGFFYFLCDKCLTLYVNPRPLKKYFDEYYIDSESTKYWATTFYKETEEARREKLWKHKAALIHEKILKYGDKDYKIVDIGAGYGTFCEEIFKITKDRPIAIEPSVHLCNVIKEKGFEVINHFLEDMDKTMLSDEKKCFTSFELFEHLHDPGFFLKSLKSIMNSGDIFMFTTLSYMGADIQAMQEKSKSVSPPHHLNFFNPKSIVTLLEKSGFEVLETTTPGKLDVDIMNNNKEKVIDNFWKNFIEYSDENEKQEMQDFLVKTKLSSHMMIVARSK